MESKHEACPRCKDVRASGDFTRALNCHDCGGKGLRRVPASYVCNQCGGPLCPAVHESNPNGSVPHGLVEKEVVGGYESEHIFDCTGYKFSLCEKCLRTMFDGFKVPPEVRHYSIGVIGDTGTQEAYAADAEWYRHRLWERAGGPAKKLETGLCNGREHCQNPAKWRHFLSDSMTHEAYCDEHKRGASNSCFVPVEALAGIPLKDRTKEQQHQVADALLRVRVLDHTRITWFNYLPEEILAAAGEVRDTENYMGGLFVPDCLPNSFGSLQCATFSEGRLFWGPRADIKQIRKGVVRALIVEARVLPGLPEEDYGDRDNTPPPEISGSPRDVVKDSMAEMLVHMREEEEAT